MEIRIITSAIIEKIILFFLITYLPFLGKSIYFYNSQCTIVPLFCQRLLKVYSDINILYYRNNNYLSNKILQILQRTTFRLPVLRCASNLPEMKQARR